MISQNKLPSNQSSSNKLEMLFSSREDLYGKLFVFLVYTLPEIREEDDITKQVSSDHQRSSHKLEMLSSSREDLHGSWPAFICFVNSFPSSILISVEY